MAKLNLETQMVEFDGDEFGSLMYLLATYGGKEMLSPATFMAVNHLREVTGNAVNQSVQALLDDENATEEEKVMGAILAVALLDKAQSIFDETRITPEVIDQMIEEQFGPGGRPINKPGEKPNVNIAPAPTGYAA